MTKKENLLEAMKALEKLCSAMCDLVDDEVGEPQLMDALDVVCHATDYPYCTIERVLSVADELMEENPDYTVYDLAAPVYQLTGYPLRDIKAIIVTADRALGGVKNEQD